VEVIRIPSLSRISGRVLQEAIDAISHPRPWAFPVWRRGWPSTGLVNEKIRAVGLFPAQLAGVRHRISPPWAWRPGLTGLWRVFAGLSSLTGRTSRKKEKATTVRAADGEPVRHQQRRRWLRLSRKCFFILATQGDADFRVLSRSRGHATTFRCFADCHFRIDLSNRTSQSAQAAKICRMSTNLINILRYLCTSDVKK